MQDGKAWNVKVSCHSSGIQFPVVGMNNLKGLSENIIRDTFCSDKSRKKAYVYYFSKLAEQLRKTQEYGVNIRGINVTISGIYSSITSDQSIIKMSYNNATDLWWLLLSNIILPLITLMDWLAENPWRDGWECDDFWKQRTSLAKRTKLNFILEMIGTRMFGYSGLQQSVINIFIWW